MKLNVGCGEFPMDGWVNLDSDPLTVCDVHADARTYLFDLTDESVEEIYAGHFLEHLEKKEAHLFIRQALRVLIPGGRLGIVVPDTREICRRYASGAVEEIEYPKGTWNKVSDLDAINELFFYSTAQRSRHRWMWDETTLARAMSRYGFQGLRRIDRFHDPRIAVGTWYQTGLDGWKPEEE